MKLYSIVFEDARTAKEALSKGVAALLVSSSETGLSKVVLFDVGRASGAITKASEFNDAMLSLGNRAIVGTVSFASVQDDLYKVSTSAGVSKFGPLTYQLVMVNIKPAWLKSDDNLTEGHASSANVWNKMYTMPEVYERKWLGDFNQDLVKKAMKATDSGLMLFRGYEQGLTEKDITRFLAKHNEPFASYGHFYAYRLVSPEAKIKSMFKSGQAFLDEMQQQGFEPEEIKSILYDAATMFFERRYK